MKSSSLLLGVLAALVLFASAVTRGADVGDCAGTVVDENGVPVPSAQIILESQDHRFFRTESDGAGRFVLRSLPAGDYKVEVRKPDFYLLTVPSFTVESTSAGAAANQLNLVLNHQQEIHERVQVTAGPDQIDPQDTAQRSSLSDEEIREIPVPSSHALQQSLVALPEIVQDNSDNLHVGGARSGETQYLLDGFEIGDPSNGALTSRFNVDATRGAEVQTARIDAAYAHSGAGVLSLETPDGDDRWRFGTTDPFPGINVQEGVHLGNWYPRFTFSGPIKRGRFWFADAVSIQHTYAVVKEQPAGANTSENWAGDNLLRLQYNVSPKHILHATFLYNRAHDINLGLDALDPQSTTLTANENRYFVALQDQVWLHDTLYEIGVAADSGVQDYIPQGTQPFVLLTNGTSGNFFERLHQRGRRIQAVGNVTAASRHWHGTHQLSAGFNVAGLRYSQSAERGEIQALRADGTLARQTMFIGNANPELSNTQAGAYAQDLWTISKRFVLQAGLRGDWDSFTLSAMAEPRISGNYLPFADDRAKFSLGWGIYNAPLNLSLIGQAYDQQQMDTFYDPTGTIPILGPVVSQFTLPGGGLQQPRFTISSAGWQQKIGANTFVDLELLARNGYHGLAYVDQAPSQPGGILLLQDHRKDRYRSATISLRHSFSETTQVYGAYTRSLAHSDEVLNPALGSIFYAAQQSGPVVWDAPNRFLSWGWTPTHIWQTQLSFFFEYRTGYPYSAVNLQQELVGPPNSLRFPAYASLNLGLERKFAFRGYLWAVRVEAVNILGRENPDTVINNVDAPNYGTFEGGQGRAFTLRLRFVGRK
ncbi:MAG TPA: carboxypeptidase regulatory-like domain-containing protein [Terriglobales bacterium]|nr:carboxypeptidase regulatory-like domain-containing protein [Terriglobales bacterium]